MTTIYCVLGILIKYVLCYSKLTFTQCEDKVTLESDLSDQ